MLITNVLEASSQTSFYFSSIHEYFCGETIILITTSFYRSVQISFPYMDKRQNVTINVPFSSPSRLLQIFPSFTKTWGFHRKPGKIKKTFTISLPEIYPTIFPFNLPKLYKHCIPAYISSCSVFILFLFPSPSFPCFSQVLGKTWEIINTWPSIKHSKSPETKHPQVFKIWEKLGDSTANLG